MYVSSFPLYRLPSIPLNDVIEYMDPIEILSISIASQKSMLLVKKLAKQLKPIDLEVNADFQFSTCSARLIRNWKISELKIATETEDALNYPLSYWTSSDGYVVPLKFHSGGNSATIFENDKTKNFTKVLEMLTSAFKVRNISLQVQCPYDINSVSLTKNENFVKSILTSFEEHKLKMKKIRLEGSYSSNDFYKFILNESRQASELELLVSPYGFLNYHDHTQFNLDFLKIYYAYWVTINNLYSFINCTSIDLSLITITGQDLNSFLEMWMLGKHKLMYMHLSMDPWAFIDIPTVIHVIQGLNAEVVDKVTEEIKADMQKYHMFGPIQCYEIQQVGGVRANIYGLNRHFFLRVI